MTQRIIGKELEKYRTNTIHASGCCLLCLIYPEASIKLPPAEIAKHLNNLCNKSLNLREAITKRGDLYDVSKEQIIKYFSLQGVQYRNDRVVMKITRPNGSTHFVVLFPAINIIYDPARGFFHIKEYIDACLSQKYNLRIRNGIGLRSSEIIFQA